MRATRSARWDAHEAERMGMRPDGLAMGDTALLLKSVVLPHTLQRLHFMTPP